MKNGRSMLIRIHRRDVLKMSLIATASILTGGLALHRLLKKSVASIQGKIVGANSKIGHMLRLTSFATPSSSIKVPTVIIGGGISGLSAGWWLEKNKHDFLILELDQEVGGNSQSGKNTHGVYPWGAHYVPIPGDDAQYVKMLFKEFGIITGEDQGKPIYNEYYLCSDPEERLLFQGSWQDGLIPMKGITDEDHRQYLEFFSYIESFKNKYGKDGKKVFNIPLDLSSKDPEFLALDKISMKSYMEKRKWNSIPLHWYVNYCCRDDYGQTSEKVSAWAGIHYFCSREGKAANSDSQTVITWPQGNGWLVEQFKKLYPQKIKTNNLVYSIQQEKNDSPVLVDYFDSVTKKNYRIEAQNVIYSGPRYTAKYVIKSKVGKLFEKDLPHAPWVIANITLAQIPSGRGQEISWDNVSYYSPSLGYIVSDHQNLNSIKGEIVITYYLPLNENDPLTERRFAFKKDYTYWSEFIRADLEKMHPGIGLTIKSLDVWVWGHGLVSPGIGYIWSEDRENMKKSLGNIHFAHSDLSGISIFEEAQYQGVLAAKKIIESHS
jgi:hypothetical protein